MGGYIYAFTGTDFNPATGAATSMNVPINTLFGNSGAAVAFRPVGLSVSAYAVSSLTNLQGNVEIAYFDTFADVLT